MFYLATIIGKYDRKDFVKMKLWKRLLSVTLSVSMLIVSGGCSHMKLINMGIENQKNKSDRYVAVICKSQDEYWDAVEKGANEAGEELGIKITYNAPENETQIDEQIRLVQEAINNNANGIVIAPLDSDKLNDVLAQATDKNIQVITIDSDVSYDGRKTFVGTDNITAGAIAARQAVNLIGDDGKVAVMAHVEGAQTTIERKGGFVDEMKESYPDIEILDNGYCDGQPDIAKDKTKQLLENNSDVDLIYATNEGTAVGVCQAVEEMGLLGKVRIIGFDSSTTEISYLQKGTIDGLIVQNPFNMGYLGVRNVNKVIDGKTIEERIDTGVTYVTMDNLNDEDTQLLLNPMGN